MAKSQARQQSRKRLAHGLHLAADQHLRCPRRRDLRLRVHDILDIHAHAAQIAAIHRSINVDDALDVVVIDHGHASAALMDATIAQDGAPAGA